MIGQRTQFDFVDCRTIYVFDLAALVANEVMMCGGVRVEMDYAPLKDFLDHPVFFQPVQRVVNRRPRSHRELAIDRRHHFVSRRMRFRRLQDSTIARRCGVIFRRCVCTSDSTL